MKRGISILVLIGISLALLYVPQSDTTPLGLSCTKKPTTQQPTTQPTTQQTSGFCFPRETQDIILATIPTQEVPVDYYYEDIRTLGWRFNVNGEGAQITGPELKILSKTIKLPLWAIEASGSNQNCKYYSFLYQRQTQTFDFELPFTQNELFDYDGDGRDENICYYSVEPISRDLLEIAALSGQLDMDLNNPCPEIRGKPLGINEPCPQTQQCTVEIPRGEIQYFGFTFEKDVCGNRLVLADNNGRQITNTELRNYADTFLSTCKQKYAVTQPQQPQQTCGNKVSEGTEECDTTDFGQFGDGIDKCKEYNPTYLAGSLKCTADCRIDDSGCKGKDIEALVNIEAYIKNVPGVDDKNPVGKIIATLQLTSAIDGKAPERLEYKLRIEGRAFKLSKILGGGYKNIFAGIVDGAMLTLAKDIPSLFAIIKEAESKQQGVVGTGIVWEKQDIGSLILVKKIYYVSTAIFDTFKKNNYEGWFIYEISMSLQQKQDGSSDLIVTSTIKKYNDNGFLLTPTKGVFRKTLTKEQSETLAIEILKRFDSYADKPLNTPEVKLEWNPEPEDMRRVLPTATEGVTTLERYKEIGKTLVLTEKLGTAEIRRYLQTLLQKYNAQSSTLSPTGDIEGFYFA